MNLDNELFHAIRRLAASVAHDMHNPLSGLQLVLQRLERNKGGGSDDIRLLKDELGRLELIANGLQLLGNPGGGVKQAYNILDITNDVIARLSVDIPLKFVNLLRTETSVYCNAAQIKQVMIDMVKNASDASREGDVVKVGLRHNEHNVFVDIMDHGCGIPPDVMERLGEPFLTTKEHGKGLGFFLAFRTMKDHQGEIRVDSRLHEGTTVTIKLPMYWPT